MSVAMHPGDCRAVLATLPDASVQCCVTSPPYFGLRAYLPDGHPDKAREIGAEPSPDAYVAELVAVFRELRRVLADTGVVFLNLGDSYNGGGVGGGPRGTLDGAGNRDRQGDDRKTVKVAALKPKDLLGIPWMVAFALRADGWWLRSDIIWAKPNPMPESVQGSHFSRHMVTIADYERLSGLPYVDERAGEDWAGDMPSLSESEIPRGKAPLSAEREGQGYGSLSGRASGCHGETAGVRCISERAGEPRTLRQDAKRASRASTAERELPGEVGGRRRRRDGPGLDQHSGAAQTPLLLLQEAEATNDAGPRGSAQQGREELTGERRSSLPVVQQQEAEQDLSDLLVGCPGCEKCAQHHGYTFHLSAGRPTSAHEHVFLLSKRASYYWDAEAVAEAQEGDGRKRGCVHSAARSEGSGRQDGGREWQDTGTRNIRNVWSIATQPYSGAHFAVMPPELAERCIKAGTSERGQCPHCAAPWARVVERDGITPREKAKDAGWSAKADGKGLPRQGLDYAGGHGSNIRASVTTGWQPTCACPEHKPVPQTVLDPFAGAGTTGLVADRLGRNAVLIELNPAYAGMARDRITDDAPLFANVALAEATTSRWAEAAD